jgi:hypothetical protein
MSSDQETTTVSTEIVNTNSPQYDPSFTITLEQVRNEFNEIKIKFKETLTKNTPIDRANFASDNKLKGINLKNLDKSIKTFNGLNINDDTLSGIFNSSITTLLPKHFYRNVIVAGGSIVSSLLDTEFGDYDIWVFGSSYDEIVNIMTNIHKHFQEKYTITEYLVLQSCITITFSDHKPVQLINAFTHCDHIINDNKPGEKEKETKPSTLMNNNKWFNIDNFHTTQYAFFNMFDIDSCRFWYDGVNYFGTHSAVLSLVSGNIIDTYSYDLLKPLRVRKYWLKGFSFYQGLIDTVYSKYVPTILNINAYVSIYDNHIRQNEAFQEELDNIPDITYVTVSKRYGTWNESITNYPCRPVRNISQDYCR